MIRVAASGTWLYDGTVPTVVRVIETDRDFWHDIAEVDGQLDDGELPQLNKHGLVYYIRNKRGWDPCEPFWPDSHGSMNVGPALPPKEGRKRAPRLPVQVARLDHRLVRRQSEWVPPAPDQAVV